VKKGRPYPLDAERRRLVRVELAKRDMTISDLARALGMHQGNLSNVISGRRLSPKTEKRIAAFLGVPAEALFPERTRGEIAAMRGRCA
jgi:lambda repressor-like predicted transcriptional regulator